MGDKLFGRGANNMKAAVAVECCLMKALIVNQSSILPKVGLMLVGDEEIGGFSGSKHLLELGCKPRCVLIGEPTELALEEQAKGLIWLKIVAHGKAAHKAYPWLGENAIAKLIDGIKIIRRNFPIPKKEVWKTTCNIGKINGGEAANKIPDQAEAILDFRHPPGENPDKIFFKVKKLLKGLGIETIFKEPPTKVSRQDHYFKKLKRSAEKILQRKINYRRAHGSLDARFFAAQGVTTLVFGPKGAGSHSTNEWVSLKSLEEYYQILKVSLKFSLTSLCLRNH